MWNRPDVVGVYAQAQALYPAEVLLFDRYVPDDSDVLDLGVGAARTTAALRARSRSYLGTDIAPAMIEVARAAHPDATFEVLDAGDLSSLAGESFDVVVFSFNGMDLLHPASVRSQCLRDVNRVLRPGGAFIFSVHNPYGRLRMWNARGGLAAWRGGIASTVRELFRMLPSRAFWIGDGYYWDPAHGGIRGRAATRRKVRREVERFGFDVREVLPGDYPLRPSLTRTMWWYYAAVKAGSAAQAT